MKLLKIPLIMFEDSNKLEELVVRVPVGSVVVSAKVMHDGIYLWYETPDIMNGTRVDKFRILANSNIIPEGGKLVAILDTIFEMEGEYAGQQGIIIFPIYKIN